MVCSPFGYCSVAITGMSRILAAVTCNRGHGTDMGNSVATCLLQIYSSFSPVAYHTLSYGDDLGEVPNGGPELLLHVAQEEVAVVGR